MLRYKMDKLGITAPAGGAEESPEDDDDPAKDEAAS
jgi:hypothetical protein